MSKPKVKWLDRTLIAGPCLTLCTSEAEYDKVVAQYLDGNPYPWVMREGWSATHQLVHPKTGDMVCIVCCDISVTHTPESWAAAMAHEAVHVWQHYIENIQEEDPSPEFEACSIQNITFNLTHELFARLDRKDD